MTPADTTDPTAFAELLRQHQGRLFSYIHSLVRDLNDAEDLLQQTTLVLWRKFAEFDTERSFLAWACGVARWETANFLRARSRHKLYFTDDLNLLLVETNAELAAEEPDESRQQALSECLTKLRERDRQLVQACYSETGNVVAAASTLGRSPQSVHNSLRRIRRSLLECIDRTLAHAERRLATGRTLA